MAHKSIHTLTLLTVVLCSCEWGFADEPSPFPPLPFGGAPIDYWGDSDDAVSRMKRAIYAGRVELAEDERWGLLPSLLRELDLSPDSQMLKWSSGSPHREIGPMQPRAIYFRDDLALAWFPGTPHIEIAVQHPRKGTLFYTVTSTTNGARIERPQRCLACHTGANTGTDVPGWQLHSDVSVKDAGASPWRNLTSPALPFEKRWQAWYVTGSVRLPSGRPFDGKLRGAYHRDTSDPAALLVRDHWLLGMNLVTRWSYEQQLQRPSDKTTVAVVRYLLMRDEVPLPKPLPRETAFIKAWEKTGPRDEHGRSLRDLDLQTRTFRYAVSPLLLTSMVQEQPREWRLALYRAIRDELDVRRDGARIAETCVILRATVPDWPEP